MVRRKQNLAQSPQALWALLAMCVCSVPQVEAAPFKLPYRGHIIDQNGLYIDGKIALEVRFYRRIDAPTAIVPALSFPSVVAKHGVFQVDLELDPTAFRQIFVDGDHEVWIEIKDLTHKMVFPRQQLHSAFAAMRVPVDGKTVTFNQEQQLRVGSSSPPTAGQFLSSDASGRLIWARPQAASPSLQAYELAETEPRAGYVLKFDGTKWHAAVDSDAASSAVASASGAGKLTAADWNRFDGKQGALGFVPVNKAGDVMSGGLAMSGEQVRQLATPLAASDAANKSYVDGLMSSLLAKDGSIPLAANWDVGGVDIFGVGNFAFAPESTLKLGAFSDAEELALAANLLAGDRGKIWFNSDSNEIKYWNGSVISTLADPSSGLGTLNSQSGLEQSLSTAISGLAPAWTSDHNVHALNLPMAGNAGVTAGLISHADFERFAGKQAALAYTPVNRAGDTLAGDFDLGQHIIKNLGSPVSSQDAVSKGYIDSALAAKLGSLGFTPLKKAGDTLGGPLDAGGMSIRNLDAPVNDGDAARKSYVDQLSNSKQDAIGIAPLDREGDAMGGTLAMNSHALTSLGDPLSASDAAHKNYVDTQLSTGLNRNGSTPLTGNWSVGGFALENVGHFMLGAQKTLTPGAFTSSEENILVGSLGSGDAGRLWFNSTSKQMRYWNGDAVISVAVGGQNLQNLNGQMGANQSFDFALAGTAADWNSASDTHVLQVPLAATSGVTAGLLSKADHTHFSTKQTALGYTPAARAGDSLSGPLILQIAAPVGSAALTLENSQRLRLEDAQSSPRALSFRAPTGAFTDQNYILPIAQGANGQVLTTDSSGNLSWTSHANSLNALSQITAVCAAGLVLKSSGGGVWSCEDDEDSTGSPSVIPGEETVSTVKIADGAVTAAKLSSMGCSLGQVFKIDQGAWVCADEANSATTNASLLTDGILNQARLSANVSLLGSSIGTSEISARAVAAAKIAPGAVQSSHLVDGSVSVAKLAGAIPDSKLDMISTAGKVSGSAISSGTIGGSASFDSTGSLWANGNIAVAANSSTPSELRIYDSANTRYTAIKVPSSLSTNVLWRLPADLGAAGDVLTTSGNGVLSWASPPSGTITNIATGTGLTGGPISGSGTIGLADVGTAGTYTKVTTNAKGQVTSGTTLVASDIPNLPTSKISSGTLALAQGGTAASSEGDARSSLGAAASGANSDITALTGLVTSLAINRGGTGATTLAQARSNLGIASSGANSDITALSALSTPISIAQGGSGANAAAGARSNLGMAASGSNSDIRALTGLTTALSVGQGGSGTGSASAARANLGIASAGANSDITSLSGLTTDLAVSRGGTGSGTTAGARANFAAARSGANSDITSLSALTTPLSVSQGGTGTNNAVSARANLNAAASGSNSDITSLSGLTTPLSVSQGGTGGNTATAARSSLNAAMSGANNNITSLAGLTTPLAVARGGTGSNAAASARANLGIAESGSNGSITSLSGLTTPLSVAQGGTGANSAANARSNLGIAASGANSDITSLTGITGRIGIGTSNPLAPVHVASSVTYSIPPYAYYAYSGSDVSGGTTGGATAAVSILTSGRVGALELNATSDRRAKENIEPVSVENALHFVRDSVPVHFRWREGARNWNYGFIAQDIYKLGYPEMISFGPRPGLDQIVDEDGFTSPRDYALNMNYAQTTSLLTKASAHFLERLQSARDLLEALSSAMKRDDSRVERLESLLCQVSENSSCSDP